MKLIKLCSAVILLFLLGCSEDTGGMNSSQLDSASINGLVDRHNFYRTEVGVADIQWSDELAISAGKWANSLKQNCDLVHSTSGNGENLWKGTEGAFTVRDVVDSWGAEKANYNYDDNTCDPNEVCGHYTQVVWANSTHVGCAFVVCEGFEIWVCQYDPPGNYIGEKPY